MYLILSASVLLNKVIVVFILDLFCVSYFKVLNVRQSETSSQSGWTNATLVLMWPHLCDRCCLTRANEDTATEIQPVMFKSNYTSAYRLKLTNKLDKKTENVCLV